MTPFVEQHKEEIGCVLSCVGRVVITGTLTEVCHPSPHRSPAASAGGVGSNSLGFEGALAQARPVGALSEARTHLGRAKSRANRTRQDCFGIAQTSPPTAGLCKHADLAFYGV